MVNAIRRTGIARSPAQKPPANAGALRQGETLEALAERLGITDPILLAEFQRLNPALTGGVAPPDGAEPTPGASVATDWTRGFGRNVARQNLYNAEIEAARREWPALDPLVLKSILAQETNFQPGAANRYGYAGIAQLGVAEARQVGLATGRSRMSRARGGVHVDRARDERLVPRLAIPGAARLLRDKAHALERSFDRHGRPAGDDYWRFVAAAYNGGEGTVMRAMRIAYGATKPVEVKWDDLVRSPDGDVRHSPLYRAIVEVGMNPRVKFAEISEYARDVVARARQ